MTDDLDRCGFIDNGYTPAPLTPQPCGRQAVQWFYRHGRPASRCEVHFPTAGLWLTRDEAFVLSVLGS